MTPKEKAEELVNKYIGLNSGKISDYSRIEFPTAKQCALIAVDEALRVAFFATDEIYQFYFDVIKEIEKL
jgi:hypothetical protein